MNVFKYIVSSKKALWLLAGAVSGAASVGVMALVEESWGTIQILGLKTPHGNTMFFAPGCIFGLTIAILLFFSSKIGSFWRSIILIGMSGIAHYVAFETAFRIADFLNYRGNKFYFSLIPAGFLAGAIGAAILGGSFYLLYPIEARWRFAIKFIGFGAIFGTLLSFVFWVGEKTNFFIGYSLLYVPWQAAISYCLSLFYAPDQENKTKLPLQEQP